MRLPCSITISFVRCLVALAFVASPLALGSTVARAQSDDEFGDDGLITLWRDYFDLASYQRQLAELT